MPEYSLSQKPDSIEPMLSTLGGLPDRQKEYIYEIKWDGFRALTFIKPGEVNIRSRNNKDFNEKFYPVHQALLRLSADLILDGEIVVINDNGLPDFELLQTWRSEADGHLCYFVFDILWKDGKSLMSLPLYERRKVLEGLISKDDEVIKLSEASHGDPSGFLEIAKSYDLEGIMAKKSNSIYQPGARTKQWIKVKAEKSIDAVICGYTKNEGTPKPFSALVLGVYEGNLLMPIAPVGTGFNAAMQKMILEKLKPLETSRCPLAVIPDLNKASRFRPSPPRAEVIWVKPKLIAEVVFRTMGSGGSYRHPSFKGLREDLNIADLKHPKEEPMAEVMSEQEELFKVSKSRKSLLNPKEETQVKIVEGHALKFTNLSKVFWTDLGLTKRDVINYYYQITPFILPIISERPQTLNRYPNGIHGKSFYQKDVKGKVPEWMQTFDYYSYTDKRAKEFLVVNNEASLLYVANLGCIEINPWSSTADHPDHPDWCIIDLDPDTNPFEQVIEAAQTTKSILDDLRIPSYCKTSGSTGLHIYIPLEKKFTYEDSKEFGRSLMTTVQKRLPDFTSIERLTSKRKNKLYLDFLQNRPQATVAAAYSIRPREGATVSMPLHWDEVKKGLSIKKFHLKNALAKVKVDGPIFLGVLGGGADIVKATQILDDDLKKKS